MLKRWLLIVLVMSSAALAAYGQSPFVVVDQVHYSGLPDVQITATNTSNPDISTLRMYLQNLPSAPNPNWPYLSSRGYDLQNNNNVPAFPEEARVFNGTIQIWSSNGQYQYFKDEGCTSCQCPIAGKCLESYLNQFFPTLPSESSENTGPAIVDEPPYIWEGIVLPGLPTNGYEPPYDPAFWNNVAKNRNCNNCYNYGANKKNNQFAQPGFNGGRQITQVDCPNVTASAIADGLIPWPANVACSNYDYKVALVTQAPTVANPCDPVVPRCAAAGNCCDYHWMRQDRGGNWSEKRGQLPATNKDDAGNLITDPRVTLMNGNLDGYNRFCTFMCVLAIPNRVNVGGNPPPPAGCPN